MTESKELILNGKCLAMDAPARTFRMKDIDGTEHPFVWTEPLDVVMIKNGQARWKAGFYLTVIYDADTHRVKNVQYWNEGKEKFPRENKDGGKRYNPHNEKAIMFECSLKAMVDLYNGSIRNEQNGIGFDAIADRVIEKAVKATGEGIKIAGIEERS